MILLLIAAALPTLFVDAAPDAAALPPGIECVTVPQTRAAAWSGRCAAPADPAQLVRLPAPGVQYRMNVAQATTAPWVQSNGWRYLRGLQRPALVEAPPGKAALAAAEAWTFGAAPAIAAQPADYSALAAMLGFLKSLGDGPGPAIADFTFFDDGSADAAENMNLFLRRNLLFRIASQPDKSLAVHAKPQSGDPSAFAYQIRQQLGDARRSLRIFGSEVVIARLHGAGNSRRVVLLNYGNRPVEGLRVRIAGQFPRISVRSFDDGAKAADIVVSGGATELSLPLLKTAAVVDLSR